MPGNNLETLFDQFQAVVPDGMNRLADSNETVASAIEQAVTQVIQVQTRRGGSEGSSATSAAGISSIFTSGLGLAPIVSGLLGLFGGGDDSSPPPLVKYAMPSALYFQGADVGSGISSADYDQMGNIRTYNGEAGAASGSGGNSQTPIQVNVQAMDAQSFLDHSSEIAAAVRQAMLNLNPINDVVNDL